MNERIEIGDHVRIGQGKVHWCVAHVYEVTHSRHGQAYLVSGLTGRHLRGVPIDNLTIHTKRSEETE